MTDYSGEQKTLEVAAVRVSDGLRVLIVDDWMETAAQIEATTSLLEAAGATIAGISVL